MTMPMSPDKWTQVSAITPEEAKQNVAAILGLPASSVVSWVVVAHIHDSEMHANLVASSLPDEATEDLLEKGLLAL